MFELFLRPQLRGAIPQSSALYEQDHLVFHPVPKLLHLLLHRLRSDIEYLWHHVHQSLPLLPWHRELPLASHLALETELSQEESTELRETTQEKSLISLLQNAQ